MKAHSLHRLLASLYNTPHLVDQNTFDFATAFLKERSKSGLMVMPSIDVDSEEDEEEIPDEIEDFDPEMGVGVIDVVGALTYKPVYGLCGVVGCSYEGILEQAQELIGSGATTIVLNIDSGGGQGYSAFECANELRSMCDASNVTLIAYNDGLCASAAYVLACVADTVVSNPYAETGSIGVLIALVNDSKALEQEGYSRTFITAGASKVPFAEDGSWREGFLEDLQIKVDSLYEDFVSHVAQYTSMTPEAIKGTEAKTFMAEQALGLGLINKIMTRSEFVKYVMDQNKGASNEGSV
jgi:ClpP class serine protease